MTASPAPASGDSAESPRPLIDSPLEGLLEWDNPFRHVFVVGSSWAPWLAAAPLPRPTPAAAPATPPAPAAKPPEPPAPTAGDQEYRQYRRDYEQRLDEAYGQWKRSVFSALFEPWIIDRRTAEAVKKLGRGGSPDPSGEGVHRGST